MCQLVMIDDNAIEHYIVKKICSNFRIFPNAIHTQDGKRFLEMVTEGKGAFSSYPEVIFLDLDMPEFSGWDFLMSLQKIYDNLEKPIDVYILSSSVDKKDIKRSLSFSFVKQFIVKPLSYDTIIDIHGNYVSGNTE
jgi:CheY-like chemotaxis protein